MAAASEHVLVELSIDSVGLARQGFGIPIILSHNATFPERSRAYTTLAAVGEDFEDDSPEYLAAQAMFSQSPTRPRSIRIGRLTGSVTLRYDLSIAAVAVGKEYAIDVEGEGATPTTVSYTPAADLTFVDGDVDATDDEITEADHGMTTGDGPYRLSNTGGALPSGTGIAVDTNVWIIVVDEDTFKLATSRANALALTDIDITSAAGGGTHTLRRAQNDVICAQLVQGLNDVVGKNFTATQVSGAGETDTVRVTADAAGDWFSLAINSPAALGMAQTHAAPVDVTIADDLADILLEDSSWYCVLPLYPSSSYLLDVAAWVEANGRIHVFTSHDTACITEALSGADDVGAEMLELGYTRTMGCYHHIPAQFMGIAEMGRWLPTQPGQATPKFKTLVGVTPTPLTDAHKFNLRGDPETHVGGRRLNAYEQVLADRAFFWEGTTFSTVYPFLDVTRNADYLIDGCSKAVLGVLVNADIVPHTEEGYAQLEGALRGFFRGEAVRRKVLVGDPLPVVEALTDDITAEDKTNRNYRGLRASGTFAGAVHKAIPVTVVLSF